MTFNFKIKQTIIQLAGESGFKLLTPRGQKILEMRFGLGKYIPQTRGDVAKEFDVTRTRISQIENNALSKLLIYYGTLLRHPSCKTTDL